MKGIDCKGIIAGGSNGVAGLFGNDRIGRRGVHQFIVHICGSPVPCAAERMAAQPSRAGLLFCFLPVIDLFDCLTADGSRRR